MQTLVDSSVWIDFFNGKPTPQTDWLDRGLGRESLLTGDLIVAEVLQGFRHDKHVRLAEEALLRFPVARIVSLEVARESARLYRLLRRRGVTVRATVDCLIAAFCLCEDLAILHSDRDFDHFVDHFGLRSAA